MEQLYNRRLGIQLDETSGFRLAECRFGAHAAGISRNSICCMPMADVRRWLRTIPVCRSPCSGRKTG